MPCCSRFVSPSILAFVLLLGQGCVPPGDPPGLGIPDAIETLGLSDADEAALAAAVDQYKTLLATQAPAEARTSLVQALAADSRIASAELSSDGYMIRIQFQNGDIAAFDTSEMSPPVPDGAAARSIPNPPPLDPRTKAIIPQLARTISAVNKCPDQVVPSSKKVKIVNAAAISNPYWSNQKVSGVYTALTDLGWTSSDIDVLARADADDQSLVIEDLLDHSGYGLVIYVGHGGSWMSSDGQEHFHLQGIRKGVYQDQIGEDRYNQWLAWKQEGKITRAMCMSEEGQLAEEVWLRDDLFDEQLTVDPGAMVMVLSCNSWKLQDEFTDNGAGAVFAWDGVSRADASRDCSKAILNLMGGPGAMNDEEALAQLAPQGLGTSTGHYGETTYFKLNSPAENLHLPAWGKFSVNPSDVPTGTATAEVTITYPDCPEASFTFTMEVGEEIDVNGLLPGNVVITITAKDAAGNILGTGSQETTFRPGGNNTFPLETCVGELNLAMGPYPAGTATVRVDIVYGNSAVPSPAPADFPVSTPPVFTDLLPGPVTLLTIARDGAGQVLAYANHDQTVVCGSKAVSLCFGWAELQPTIYPPETARIVVTSSDPNAPGPIDAALGGTTPMYGFTVGGNAAFTAQALDAQGRSLGTSTTAATITCGANTVDVRVATYDIILTVEPTSIAADGIEVATLTATLRTWLPSDTSQPTGDPVAGKNVTFVTSLGDFVGPTTVQTGPAGTASIGLIGTVAGTATVRAVVMEDDKEAVRIVKIGAAGGYFQDFEGLDDFKWSTWTTGLIDSRYLGPLACAEIDSGELLTLTGLPWHNRIIVDFDLIIMGAWSGDGCTIEDVPWNGGLIDVDVSGQRFEMDYSYNDAPTPGNLGFWRRFASPSGPCGGCTATPGDCNDPSDALRVVGGAAVYHIHVEFQHSGETLILKWWQDERNRDLMDWYDIPLGPAPTFGLDNVSVQPCKWSGTHCQ